MLLWGCLFCLVCGNLEPQSAEFGEVLKCCCTEGCPPVSLEKCYPPIGILLLEPEGKGPCVKVYEWHPVVAQHGDLGEHMAVLCSLGNH